MCCVRDPIFSPEFPFRSISFSQISKKSVPEHHNFTFLGGFCHSGYHHFQNFFNFNPFIASHGRLSPNAKRSAAPRVSQTRPVSSGDWHFHAQNGSSSFRSPCPFFTLPRHIPTKIWSEYPPPPPPPEGIEAIQRGIRGQSLGGLLWQKETSDTPSKSELSMFSYST